ncbi:MAG TPA: hypothetical protein VGH67_09725 [Solirubrobacteraceae bacterium]|jgi:hypothetical protein
MRDWRQKDEMELDGAFREIAFIRMAPADFAERFEIVFTRREHGKRELLSYAAIELYSGTRFFLQHEHNLSNQGIWLYGDAERDAGQQRDEFADAFGIDPADIAAF